MQQPDRAMILRLQLHRLLSDPAFHAQLGWRSPAQVAVARERLWPEGVVPEQGSKEWWDRCRVGFDEENWLDALLVAVAAQALHRRIVVRFAEPTTGFVQLQHVAPTVGGEKGDPIGLDLQGGHYMLRDLDPNGMLPPELDQHSAHVGGRFAGYAAPPFSAAANLGRARSTSTRR